MGTWFKEAHREKLKWQKPKKDKIKMGAFTYSADDVARTQIVAETVWLPVDITDYQEKVSKKEGREGIINHTFTFKVKDGEYKGLVILAIFPEDYPGMAFQFLTAMGNPPQKGGGVVNLSEYKGRDVLICVEPGEYQGKPSNNIVGYRPINWSPGTEE